MNGLEETICNVWKTVLGISEFSQKSQFGELGGTSITWVMCVHLMLQNELDITEYCFSKDVTIQDLMNYLERTDESPLLSEYDSLPTLLPDHGDEFHKSENLLGCQKWLLESQLFQNDAWVIRHRYAFNYPVTKERLVSSFSSVLADHPGLRTLFFLDDENTWCADILQCGISEIGGLGLAMELAGETVGELPSLLDAQSRSIIEERSVKPLIRMLIVLNEGGLPNEMFILVHHLIIDAVSTSVLEASLEAYLRAGESNSSSQVRTKVAGADILQLARRKWRYVRSAEVAEFAKLHWVPALWSAVAPVELDFPNGENTEASSRQISIVFSESVTDSLVGGWVFRLGYDVEELVILALMEALYRWNGRQSLQCCVMNAGRGGELMKQLQLQSVVAWVAKCKRFLIERKDGCSSYVDQLDNIRSQMKQLAQEDVTIDEFIGDSGREAIAQQISPYLNFDILINHYGSYSSRCLDKIFRSVELEKSATNESVGLRHNKLVFMSKILDNRLHLTVEYSENLHKNTSIQYLLSQMGATFSELSIEQQSGMALTV